jgi:hypothetical protein
MSIATLDLNDQSRYFITCYFMYRAQPTKNQPTASVLVGRSLRESRPSGDRTRPIFSSKYINAAKNTADDKGNERGTSLEGSHQKNRPILSRISELVGILWSPGIFGN